MLTGGFYAEIQLTYDATVAEEKGGKPFGVEALRPIQLSKSVECLMSSPLGGRPSQPSSGSTCYCAVSGLNLLRLATEPQDILLLRMVPFIDRNYNVVELGPRGTGKSHLYQQVSPSAHLISGGQGDCGAHVRQQRRRASAVSSPSTTSSASTKSPACPSTRRMESIS